MNQLSFFEDIDEKEMRSLVVKELKNYKALCVRMKNQEEQAQVICSLYSRQEKESTLTCLLWRGFFYGKN
ncbi:hypothetical protein ACWKTS_16615 [Bacillus toyonensis]